MSRRRSTPWLHRWSRVLIGAIAIVGAVVTGYLTVSHFQGQSVACPTTGCESVLSSQYANIGGLPLSLFGTLAYAGMAFLALSPLPFSQPNQRDLRKKLEDWTWLLLLVGSISMVTFSGYLMYLLLFKISAICIYCVASAVLTLLMFLLTLFGREWPDMGQVFFTGFIVAVLAVVGSLVLYASTTTTTAGPTTDSVITNTSGPAEVALADHLATADAKMYGAYWCPHCHDQKELFGKEAFAKVNYIECDPNGENPQPEVCQAANITGYPTWEVKDQRLEGAQPLLNLAKASGYSGPQNFQNVVPQG